MPLHPATWIVLWGLFAIGLQSLGPRGLLAVGIPAIVLAAWLARDEVMRLFRRARWLLLTIGLLFAFATPGERLPPPYGEIGLTVDGLAAAGEHLLRLAALLATLAWLWHGLGRDGWMAGLHRLLRPLGSFGDRVVVRLVLALGYVEREEAEGLGARNWRAWLEPAAAFEDEPGSVRLPARIFGAADAAVLAACGAALLLMMLR